MRAAAQRQRRARRRRLGLRVDPPRTRRPGADQRDQLEGPRERGGRRVVVGAALEAVRRLRGQPETARRAPHLGGREMRALDGDGRRGARDLGVAAAHDAAEALRARRVGDDEHVRRRRPCHAVERPDRLARRGPAGAQLALGQPRQIVGVDRVAGLEQHVVGDVDDVVDAADAAGGEAAGEPGRRRPDRHVGEAGGEPRAQRRRPRSSRAADRPPTGGRRTAAPPDGSAAARRRARRPRGRSRRR